MPNVFQKIIFVIVSLAIYPAATVSAQSIPATREQTNATCSLVARDGRDLNPRKLVLANPATCHAVVDLYEAVVDIQRSPDFVFEITGGDRYLNSAGVILSSSNHQPVKDSVHDSQHLKGGEAVDIRIRGVDAKAVLQAAARTAFAGGYIDNTYADRHWHFGLPRGKTA